MWKNNIHGTVVVLGDISIWNTKKGLARHVGPAQNQES